MPKSTRRDERNRFMTVPARPAGNNRLLELLRRFWGLGLVGVTTILAVATQPYDNGPVIRADGYGYHAWTYAILRGDLNFRDLPNETYAFTETRPGYFWNSYPPGVALARLPVMAWLVGHGDDFGRPTPAEHVAAAILSLLALMATAALLFYTCRAAGASDLSANVAAVAVVFGTGLFHYATYDAGYSHVWTALGMAALVALAARSRHRGGRIPVPWVVVLAVWLVLVRNTNVFALAILGAAYLFLGPWYLGATRRTAARHAAWLATGMAAGVAIQLALNTYGHGRFVLASYHGQLFRWDQPMHWSVLTSVAEHGVLPYYPVTLLLVLLPFTARTLRPGAFVFATLVGVYVLLYGFWNAWHFGAAFGARGFVDILPLGAPLFAAALTQLLRPWRRAVIVVTFLCVYASASLMAGYWRRSVPYHEITAETYWSHVVGQQQLIAVMWRNAARIP
jgi:hypothetical protein